MDNLLALIPLLPFLGFLVLFLVGRHLPRTIIAAIGAGTVGIAALLTILLGFQFLQSTPEGGAYTQTLWQWLKLQAFPALLHCDLMRCH